MRGLKYLSDLNSNRKLRLIGLVYDCSIGQVMQFIVEGLPDFWTTRFNVQFIDTIIEF
jgi:hypothetical protein